VPRDSIERILVLNPDRQCEEISQLQGQKVLRSLDDTLIPLIELRDVLKIDHCEAETISEDLSIVVIRGSSGQFGLIVDGIHDTEETVIKPMSNYLNRSGFLLAATFQGSGQPGLILDLENIEKSFKISGEVSDHNKAIDMQLSCVEGADASEFLFFELNNGKKYSLPLCFVYRLENIDRRDIEFSGELPVVRYRDSLMALISLDEKMGFDSPGADSESSRVIVIKHGERYFGLEVEDILDVKRSSAKIDDSVRDRVGILGNFIINDEVIVILDVWELLSEEIERLAPKKDSGKSSIETMRSKIGTILYAEDVDFYRDYVRKGLEKSGFNVIAVESGKKALERAQFSDADEYSLLLTDIRMPDLDGYGLAEGIRKIERFHSLPIIALTAHTDETEIKKGEDFGFSGYIEKLNVESVIERIDEILEIGRDKAQSVSA